MCRDSRAGDITFVTNTDSDSQALELFKALGFPFRDNNLEKSNKLDKKIEDQESLHKNDMIEDAGEFAEDIQDNNELTKDENIEN